jgi:outer membrane protein OmpA-like peptidoglycan-associated protein
MVLFMFRGLLSELPVLIFFFLVSFTPAYAQDDDCGRGNKKAEKYYNQALTEYNAKNYRSLDINLRKALEEDNEFVDAYLLKARLAEEAGNHKAMADALGKALEICPDIAPSAYFKLGSYFFSLRQYEDALTNLRKFSEYGDIKPEEAARAGKLIETIKFRLDALSNPVPFDPESVEGISTAADEYLPIISPDNEIAFFTRRFSKESRNNLTQQLTEEFTFSRFENNMFGKGEKMPPPFNTNEKEGGATVTIDNKHLYFTICRPEQKGINCDIYYSGLKNNTWQAITNMGEHMNDPLQWDSQPSISSDGNTLYFASTRDGGFGGIDIYKCTRDEDGKWGKPVNLGPGINTSGNEKSPFIHTDSKTLYFSSDSLTGMGGYDIFYSRQLDNGEWQKPKNIGYPINTESDDLGFFVSTDGKTGYFASNKLQGKGGWDIYSFFLYPEARPERVLFIKGELKDEITGKPLRSHIEFKDTQTMEVYRVNVDSATGQYVSALNFRNDYIMTVKGKDIIPVSRYISKDDTAFAGVSKLNLSSSKVEVGKPYTLNDIYFATNSFSLTDASQFVLLQFADFLKENPSLKILIEGHTDNVNDDQSNLILSENRAKAVYDFLVSSEIEPSRLSFKGFGESRPVSSNDTEAGRARNRRTQFVVLSR